MTHQDLVAASAAHIQQVLRGHVPPKTDLYLFGSRARGNAGFASDFDVLVEADLDSKTLNAIKELLEDSFVPFHVDIVPANRLKGRFAQEVQRDKTWWATT